MAMLRLERRKENRKMNRIALHTDNVVITFAFRKKTGASRENLSVTLQTNTNPYWNI